MIRKRITDRVKFNCDDPEKMIVTEETLNKKTWLFGWKIFDWEKKIEQGFDNKDSDNKIGFR